MIFFLAMLVPLVTILNMHIYHMFLKVLLCKLPYIYALEIHWVAYILNNKKNQPVHFRVAFTFTGSVEVIHLIYNSLSLSSYLFSLAANQIHPPTMTV